METPAQTFARKLRERIGALGLTQSDLARKIWGDAKDGRRYHVARNRDRISSYLAGTSVPGSRNRKLLAKAVCMPDDELIGGLPLTAGNRRGDTVIDFRLQPDGLAAIQIRAVVPLDVVFDVIAKIRDRRSPKIPNHMLEASMDKLHV